ncbi:MAG: hypothetical protein IJ841_06525 [Prevotella sp.]|nr:hypothetical protein [Prevotella sp.]
MNKFNILLCGIVLCLFCTLSGRANEVADSLLRQLPTLEGAEKSDAYNMLDEVLGNCSDFDRQARILIDWAEFEHQRGNKKGEGQARINRLIALNNAGRYAELTGEVEDQMKWFAQNGQWERYYMAWNTKCDAYYYDEKLQTALREARLMQTDAGERNNAMGKAMASLQMGSIYLDLGLQKQAISALRLSLQMFSATGGSSGMESQAYDYLCQAYDAEGDYDAELQTSLDWRNELDRLSRGRNTGQSSLNGEYITNGLSQAAALIGLGRISEAEREIKSAEIINSAAHNPIGKQRTYMIRSRLALAQGKLSEALQWNDRQMALGMESGVDTRYLRADILLRMGRYEEAARLYKEVFEEKDTMFTREMRIQLDELHTLFKVDDLKMQNQMARSRLHTGVYIFLGIVVGALLLFIYFRHKAAMRLEREHQLLVESNEKLAQSYRELKVANARAEESSKMKTNFIQQISHEIRTPLNVLSGFTQIITTPGIELDEATLSEAKLRITENTDRITGLVNKMLELSDASSQTVIERNDEVPAVQIAAQAAEESRIGQATHLTFDLQLGEGTESLMLHTNLSSATRALVLLLDNARKFTRSAEPLHPEEQDQKQAWVVLRVQVPTGASGRVAFVVEDTGIGIAKEEAEHIFDEFVQLDEYYDGTGIGLTVARSLARRLGGDIVLDTTYEDGARFVFTLPL